MKTFCITGTYTDVFQLTVGPVYYLKRTSQQEAVFDYFFRKRPYSGGYAVFAGLSELLEILAQLSFSREDLEYLKHIGLDHDFVGSLHNFKFQGTIYSVKEGEVVFLSEPLVRVDQVIFEFNDSTSYNAPVKNEFP